MNIKQEIASLVSELNRISNSNAGDLEIQSNFKAILKSAINIDVDASEVTNEISNFEKKSDSNESSEQSTKSMKKIGKPSMGELMEAISGKSLVELYSEKNSNWKEVSQTAATLLRGVIGDNIDSRDWNKILLAEDVLQQARIETRKMHQPTVSITTEINDVQGEFEQYAVVKDKNGEILTLLSGNLSFDRENLRNLGVIKNDIAAEIFNRNTNIKIPKNTIEVLLSYAE